MNENTLIIGNGFDLDLGLKTNYLDFADSTYWPKLESIYKPYLKSKLEERISDNPCWFDIEEELLKYATIDKSNKTLKDYASYNNKIDQDFFNKLLSGFCEYLENEEKKDIIKDSYAAKVLSSVVLNGYFEHIYSFNYTNLNTFAKRLNITKDINYNHIHGKIKDRSIILGVNESQKLISNYEFLYKSSSPYYKSNNLDSDLFNSKEVVIFGLSFGHIDFQYFDYFFKSILDAKIIPSDKKKHITIFTKDDNSRMEILKKLRDKQIIVTDLYQKSYFEIIKTTDPKDIDKLDSFIKRLNNNSIDKFNENLSKLERMIY